MFYSSYTTIYHHLSSLIPVSYFLPSCLPHSFSLLSLCCDETFSFMVSPFLFCSFFSLVSLTCSPLSLSRLSSLCYSLSVPFALSCFSSIAGMHSLCLLHSLFLPLCLSYFLSVCLSLAFGRSCALTFDLSHFLALSAGLSLDFRLFQSPFFLCFQSLPQSCAFRLSPSLSFNLPLSLSLFRACLSLLLCLSLSVCLSLSHTFSLFLSPPRSCAFRLSPSLAFKLSVSQYCLPYIRCKVIASPASVLFLFILFLALCLSSAQSTHMAYGKVTEETVYTCTGHPLRSDIANILDWALNKDFTTAYNRIPNAFTLSM